MLSKTYSANVIILSYSLTPRIHVEVERSKQMYEPLILSIEHDGVYLLMRVAKLSYRDYGTITTDSDGRHEVRAYPTIILEFTPEKAYSLIMSTDGIKGASYLPNKDIRERSNKPHITSFIDDDMVVRANWVYQKAKQSQDSPYDDDQTDNYRQLDVTRDTDPTHNKTLE